MFGAQVRAKFVVMIAVLGLLAAPVVATAAPATAGKAASTKTKVASKAAPARPTAGAAARPTARASAPSSARAPARAAARPTTAARTSKAAPAASARATRNQPVPNRTRHAASGQKSAIVPVSRRAPAAAAVAGVTTANLAVARPEAPMSLGEAIGLHRVADPLALRSAVALVVDPANGEVLFQKNIHAVLPIASITKVMTAMVVIDAGQPLDELVTIEDADRDTERHSSSRLPIGSQLTRGELLKLALMSSENRAASALARNYPGGFGAYVRAANLKAQSLGMRDSVFTDGTGLSAGNVSTARDLAVMVASAVRYPLIRTYSTSFEEQVRTAGGPRIFRTTNRLVASDNWSLDLQKTGYISEAGNCLVMAATVDGRQVIMVLLDSQGRHSRLGDAQRLRRWIEG